MAKRPDISVIVLYNRGVARADFNKGKPDPVSKIQESVDVESTIKEAVEQVVDGKPVVGSRAIVISTDVWSQIVALPRLSVMDIEPTDLDEVLKFEAETLSGIEIDEISLASTPLGRQDDFQNYWVSAIRQSDLDSVHRVLESASCREIVVAHPAGLSGDPTTIDPEDLDTLQVMATIKENQVIYEAENGEDQGQLLPGMYRDFFPSGDHPHGGHVFLELAIAGTQAMTE